MTIIAGFSSSRQGSAPLNLAAQVARNTGDKIVAAAIVERPWPPRDDPVESEYLRYVTSQASQSLDRVVGQLPDDVDVSTVVHQSTSIPTGLMELVSAHDANLVVVGSSSSGLLGRVDLGQCHRAACPHCLGSRRDRSARLPVGIHSDTPADRCVRRRSRYQRPHPGSRRACQNLVSAATDRLVHGTAGSDVRRLD